MEQTAQFQRVAVERPKNRGWGLKLILVLWAFLCAAVSKEMTPGTSWVTGLIIGAGVGVIYFLPALIAYQRYHKSRHAIFVLNLLFGGTGIGWVAALIWALTNPHHPETIFVQRI